MLYVYSYKKDVVARHRTYLKLILERVAALDKERENHANAA
jgi:hypothetical protein